MTEYEWRTIKELPLWAQDKVWKAPAGEEFELKAGVMAYWVKPDCVRLSVPLEELKP